MLDMEGPVKRYVARECLLAYTGMLLSFYMVYVELNKSADAEYEALCDISQWLACSGASNTR